ncbi:hypothetical protein [Streptomyces xiamenensis]|uniref:hypothetical protein n=1 Tax=Streptomyces xiamenensis TaxID=408015 RepID=UPI0037D496E5
MSSALPPLFVHRFLEAKDGSTVSECEDALHIRPESGPDEPVTHALCAAVADGASESLLAGRWARVLVEHTAEIGALHPETFRDPGSFAGELVHRAVTPWADLITQYTEQRTAQGRPVQWYEQPGLDKGAFATLAAVRLTPSPDAFAWHWRAVALGDSCLFHLDNDGVRSSFPLTDSSGFGLTPQLLGSRNNDVALIADRLQYAEGQLYSGQRLLLATDALAAWVMRARENHISPWRELGEVTDQGPEKFSRWVGEQRMRKLMRNDDVALLRIDALAERTV